MSRWLITILFLLGSAFLTRLIPFSSFFRSLDTMIHEFGHALMTLLLSGRVLNMELYADHSGVTYSTMNHSWHVIPIALAGYMTASLFAMLLFYLHYKKNQKLGLTLVTFIALFTLLLFVRQGFGVIWLIGFIALNLIVLLLSGNVQKYYYLFLAFLTLEESVVGPAYLVLYAVTKPGSAGDATNLSDFTLLPALVWAIFFVLFALWCASHALRFFFKQNTKKA